MPPGLTSAELENMASPPSRTPSPPKSQPQTQPQPQAQPKVINKTPTKPAPAPVKKGKNFMIAVLLTF